MLLTVCRPVQAPSLSVATVTYTLDNALDYATRMIPRFLERIQGKTVLAMPKPKLEYLPAAMPQEKLKLPAGLPGIDAPPIAVPPIDPDKGPDPDRAKAIQSAYPQM